MTHTISNPELLIIEDEKPKLNAVCAFLSEEYPNLTYKVAQSFTSATSAISENNFKICIIDMSIPTYDFEVDNTGGGNPQAEGGTEILRFLESESPETRAIVLTQYNEFSDEDGKTLSIESLRANLTAEFGHNLIELIYYSGQKGEWRSQLKEIFRENNYGN